MTSWKLAVFAIATALAVGCDDGPGQTFQPLPPGVNAPNAGDNGGFTDPSANQGLGTSTAGQNGLQICTPEKLRRTVEAALQQPIVPIRGAGGIDGSVNLAFTGLTIDQIESGTPPYTQTAAVPGLPPPPLGLCQSTGGNGRSNFGEQGELSLVWSTTTRLVTSIQVFSGYRGVLAFQHPTTSEKYTVSLQSKPIDVNGQPVRWNWRDTAARAATATKIYNAIMLALAPDKLPKDANNQPKESANCTADGGCIATILGNVTGALAIVPLGFLQIYFDIGVDDPIGKDLPTRLYVPIQKDFPYTNLPVTVKLPGALDQTGPVSTGTVGAAMKTCSLTAGMSYGDFVDNCVRVTGTPASDDGEEKKFLAGLTHGAEVYRVDVVGIDPLFLSAKVRDALDPVTITDTDRPDRADPLERLTFDQQVKGKILNDYRGESPTQPRDNHGSGLVNLMYAILVQQALDAADVPTACQTTADCNVNQACDPVAHTCARPKHPIGDPACKLNPDGTLAAAAALGCTGMEGFVTTAPAASVTNTTSVPAAPLANVARGSVARSYTTSTGLKPANNQIASFLDDPTSFPGSLNNDVFVVTWAGSAKRVIKVLGHGNRLNVPNAFREPRAYATLWMQALTQYFIARGNVGPNVTLQDVIDAGPGGAAAVHIDPNYFFFDTEAAIRQQFDTAEYILRDFATADRPWFDFRIVVDATGGILNQFTFDVLPLKGERAILGALAQSGKPIGADGTMLLTNAFGSATLSGGWHEPVNTTGPYKTAYDCASADLRTQAQVTAFVGFCGADNLPPVDATGNFARNAAGRPLLEPYKGGFASTSTVLNLGRNIGAVPNDLFTALKKDPSLELAKIQFATRTETYNPLSAPGTNAAQVVGYTIPTNSTGFFIPINASRDRFVQTEDYFTSGNAITTTLKVVPALEKPGAVRLSSVDTNDFLGEVFVCADNGELLTVRMFTPGEVVLDWLLRHPAAYASCNIIVDYWEYGTVLSRVTSIANGVIVNFTRPSGITGNANNSAVSDVDLFAVGQ